MVGKQNNKGQKIETMFETWVYKGVRFLAVARGFNVAVIDENGLNYGSWMSVTSFRNRQRRKDIKSL